MPVQTYNVGNKLLSIYKFQDEIYVGDFKGNLYLFDPNTFSITKTIFKTQNDPISAITVDSNYIFFGTWKGVLYVLNRVDYKVKKEISFGESIIKSMFLTQEVLFVASSNSVAILNSKNFNISRTIQIESKVLSIFANSNIAFFGTGIGKIYSLDLEGFQTNGIIETHYKHETSVNAIYEINGLIVTGSADKLLKVNSKILFSFDDWVRCIDENLVGVGKSVYSYDVLNLTVKHLFDHEDYVSGIVSLDSGLIISIGLDCTIKVLDNEIKISSAEEKEIEEFMKQFN